MIYLIKHKLLMDNIKEFTLSLVGNDLDKNICMLLLGELHINKNDVNINNLQTIKNSIQDIVTLQKTEVDKGE